MLSTRRTHCNCRAVPKEYTPPRSDTWGAVDDEVGFSLPLRRVGRMCGEPFTARLEVKIDPEICQQDSGLSSDWASDISSDVYRIATFLGHPTIGSFTPAADSWSSRNDNTATLVARSNHPDCGVSARGRGRDRIWDRGGHPVGAWARPPGSERAGGARSIGAGQDRANQARCPELWRQRDRERRITTPKPESGPEPAAAAAEVHPRRPPPQPLVAPGRMRNGDLSRLLPGASFALAKEVEKAILVLLEDAQSVELRLQLDRPAAVLLRPFEE